MIQRDGDFPPDRLPHLGQFLAHQRRALVGQLNAGERMLAVPCRIAQRIGQRAGNIANAIDAQVQFQEGEALFDSLLKAVDVGVGCIRIKTDTVAIAPAEHLVDRHAIRLARQVPKGHLDGGNAAALPSMRAELPDAFEDLLDVAGILVKESALEDQGISFAAAVAHLTIAGDPLVGVDADERAAEWRPGNHRNPQVCNPQL